MHHLAILKKEAINLLKKLVTTPSLSKQEEKTADIIYDFFKAWKIEPHRQGNNIWVKSLHWDDSKPIILLNSHHDTVKPTVAWTKDPFQAIEEKGRLYGLGSNDAGGPLVSLIATFLHFYPKENLPFNLILAATAEEEISGPHGVASILPQLGSIEVGIIGEPSQMQMAIAEKGLMVIDAEAEGKAGHAARNEGENAIYKALEDIQWLQAYSFEKDSPLLGPVKMTATQIEAGTQHNVVPDSCRFVIDVRTNELYSNQAVFEILQQKMHSKLTARSFRLNSSRIDASHPLVESGLNLGLPYFGSPTLSDQALMSFPTLKIGPGDSARSHTADEYIGLKEIEEGIEVYIKLLEGTSFE